jgi:hypothetical protein
MAPGLFTFHNPEKSKQFKNWRRQDLAEETLLAFWRARHSSGNSAELESFAIKLTFAFSGFRA